VNASLTDFSEGLSLKIRINLGESEDGYVGVRRAAGSELAAVGVSNRSYSVFKSMKNFVDNDSGATAIEYALIASLIAVFIITAVQTVGTRVSTVFTEVGNALK
jgi:pilus assembly protein Flp/PilA